MSVSEAVPFADRAAAYDLMWVRGEIGMFIVAPDGTIKAANPRICELLGYTPVELVGKTFQEITKHDDVGPDVEMLRRLLLGEIDHYRMDKTYHKKDGMPLFIHLVVWPIVDPETKKPRLLFSQVIPKKVITEPREITTTEVRIIDCPSGW